MSSLYPVFKSRAFGAVTQPALSFQVDSCTYSDQGGPRTARLVARCAGNPNLDQLLSLLRCPVELWTGAGRLSWWGLVWSVTLQDGAASATVTLDDLANRVQTAYASMQPAASGAGTRQTTPWLDDLTSQAVYGIKEQQLTLSMATQTQAEAFRATYLAASSKPIIKAGGCGPASSVKTGSGPYGRLITLELRGWWDTLAWRYYAAAPLVIENINQFPTWEWDFGITGVYEQVAQRITIPSAGWFAGIVYVDMRRTQAVASNIVVSLCANNAGVPGSVVSSASYDGSLLQVKNGKWIPFVLSPGSALAAGDYWIKISDSAPSGSSHYRIAVEPGKHYLPGEAKLWNGAAWFTLAPDADLWFRFGCTLETTEQIRAMLTSAGQFFTGLRLEAASGLYTNPHRAGDTTALAEITRHLQAGTAAGLPLTAEVTPDRSLAIKTKADPLAGSAFKIGRDGIIRLPGGAPATPGPGIAGSWAALDVPWATTAASWGLAPGLVYLKDVEWKQTLGCVMPGPAIS